MKYSKVVPLAAGAMLVLLSMFPQVDQSPVSIPEEHDLDMGGSYSLFDATDLELELLLEGSSPAFFEVGRLVRSICKTDDVADADIGAASNEPHKDRAFQLLESNNIEYSIGYCEEDVLSAALVGYRHVCSGRDIKARVRRFQRPFFSGSDIKIVLRKSKNHRYGGYSISG